MNEWKMKEYKKFEKEFWKDFTNLKQHKIKYLLLCWFNEFMKQYKKHILIDWIQIKDIWSSLRIFYKKNDYEIEEAKFNNFFKTSFYWSRCDIEIKKKSIKFWFSNFINRLKKIWLLDNNLNFILKSDATYFYNIAKNYVFCSEEEWKRNFEFDKNHKNFYDKYWRYYVSLRKEKKDFLCEYWFEKFHKDFWKIKKRELLDIVNSLNFKEDKEYFLKEKRNIINETVKKLNKLNIEIVNKNEWIWINKMNYKFHKDFKKFVSEFWRNFVSMVIKSKIEMINYWFNNLINLFEKRKKEWRKIIWAWLYRQFKIALEDKETYNSIVEYDKFLEKYWKDFSNSKFISYIQDWKIKFEKFEKFTWFLWNIDFYFKVRFFFLFFEEFNWDSSMLKKKKCFYCDSFWINFKNKKLIERIISLEKILCENCDKNISYWSSKAEKDIFSYVKYLNNKQWRRFIEWNKYFYLNDWGNKRREIDIFDSMNLKWIEYNWIYWHSNDWERMLEKKKIMNDLWWELMIVWEDFFLSSKRNVLLKIRNFLWKYEKMNWKIEIRKIRSDSWMNFIKKYWLKFQNDFWNIFIWLFQDWKLRSVLNFNLLNENEIDIKYFESSRIFKDTIKKFISYIRNEFKNIKKITFVLDVELWWIQNLINSWFKKVWEINQSFCLFNKETSERIYNKQIFQKENNDNFSQLYDLWKDIYEFNFI